MADIYAFHAFRYNPTLSENIDELVSPLFDVVSEKERERLYKNPFNSIHLSVPSGDFPADLAFDTLQKWLKDGVLLKEKLSAIFPYYQYFTLPGSRKQYCRKGFISHIKAHFWEEKQVLRHENTIPGAVGDRLALLEKIRFHTSPVHGLYADDDFELEKYMDEAMQAPVYETEDYQGVREVLGIIQDAKVIDIFIQKIQNRQIILADGHHRYESAIELRKKQENVSLPVYLTNMRANDICILPTHRLIKGLEDFDKGQILSQLEQYFTIRKIDNPYTIEEVICGRKWTFGLIFKHEVYKIALKPEVWHTMQWHFPEVIRGLDLTVLHYFVIEKVLGIAGKVQRSSPNLSFSRSLPECLEKVQNNEMQMAFITQSVTIEEVETVCHSGYVMPQKSTYFYPKAIAGLVFSNIDGQ
jgi:uncharacterized protein (DUF1015 family)